MPDQSSRLEWILKNSIQPEYKERAPLQEYGDLSELNENRLILDAVGRQTLFHIAEDAIDLLDTSVAVYEKTGDYAFGMFASGWCRLMDGASRQLCRTDDNREALASGRWLCHENCWNDSAKAAIESGKPVDIACAGGIRLYSEPIFAGQATVGAIHIGYGTPPTDAAAIKELSRKFDIPEAELQRAAETYVPRPDFVVEIAKKRLQSGARLIGQMVERWQRELELLESKRRMDTLLSNLPGMAYRCRNVSKWTMKFVSQGCLALTGYTAEELTGDRGVAYGDLVHPEDAGHVWQEVQQSLAQKNHFEIEYRLLDKGGAVKWVWERGVATGRSDADGVDLLEGFISDITERKAAEESRRMLERQVHHGRRIEAIGRLAGGIAHDFNNLLFVILGYSEMMLQNLPDHHPDFKSLQEIYNAARRGRDLVAQMLAFGRQQHLEMQVVDVNRVISGFEEMLRRMIGEDIGMEVNLSETPAYVKADISQVEQILMNIAVNARDAMPDGGVLQIESMLANPQEGGGPDLTEEHVCIRMRDTGTGMDRETLEKVFEPFFSTKGMEKGTGLGLSTVYGIVRQHGGSIRVYSEPGRGSDFLIYLPRADAEAAAGQVEPIGKQLPMPESKPANVLVVEDEPTVRKLTCKILAEQGHRVIESGSASEAIEQADHSGKPIHLLITDVVMPEMKGPEVYKRIAERHPDLQVLYMSGYSQHVLPGPDMNAGSAGFIQKPFSMQELRQKVSELLAG